jgi:hypothetical protein
MAWQGELDPSGIRGMPLRFLLVLLLLCLARTVHAGSKISGWIRDDALPEVSGMVVSRAHPDILWVENDSGNPAAIYAVTPEGSLRATIAIDGAPNIDWEDLAAFDLDGRHYVLIADTGDNGGARKTLALHVIEEPAALRNGRTRLAWSIAFRWPDGARDCEAVAVDVDTDSILLISKKRVPAELFRLPLRSAKTGAEASGVLTAQFLGTLAGIPQPTREQLKAAPGYAKYLAQVSAADIAPDRSILAVLTYRSIYLYRRRGDEDWAHAVSRAPQPLSFGWLPQAEALGFAGDGRSLYVSGEHLPSPIVHADVPVIH